MSSMRAVWTFALLWLAAASALPGAQGATTVTLRVTDVVRGTPIPGVSVKMIAGTVIRGGITNGNGVFQGIGFKPKDVVDITYEMVSYVRRPERASVTATTGDVAVNGSLVKDTSDAAYVAELPGFIVLKVGTVLDKKAAYHAEWGRITEMPADAQAAIAKRLLQTDANVYLADVASFRVASKGGN